MSEKSLRILILEDNPHDAELTQFELEEAGLTFTSKVVMAEAAYIEAIEEFRPDLILADYDLPTYNGALALAEAKRRRPDTPFILVTGAVTEERAIEILTGGARDFVMKGRLNKLALAVRRAIAEADEHRARRKAEEEAHAASLYSRTLIEASLDPLVTISAEGKVMDVNRATETVTGISREQIIGTDFSDYFTEPEKARFGYRKVFSEGSVTDYPLAIRHVTGRVTEVLYNATTYLDKEGKVQGVFAAARDVAKLKNAEEELRAAHQDLERQVTERTADLQKEIEQRYRVEQSLLRYNERLELLSYTASRLLASDNPQQIVEELCLKVMAFVDCDAFFNFLVDETVGRLHLNACAGIPKESMREIKWLDYGVAVCGCAARDACRIVAENIPATPDVRTELVKSYGIKAYACHPLMQENRVLGTLSFGTRSRTTFSADDLAMMKAVADHVAVAMARIRTENALRESEQRYRQIIHYAPTSICEVDFTQGHFIEVNDEMCQILGYTRQELLATSIFSILDDEDAVRFTSWVQRSHSEERPARVVEYRVRTKEGRLIWALMTATFRWSAGRIVGATVVAHDITEQKQTEESLRKLNAELEARVAEQTVEIRQTCDLAEEERQRFYNVLEMLPAYVILLTPNYQVPFANRTFRERFGQAPGERCYEHLFGRTEPCEICETYTVLKTGKSHQWQWKGPDGRIYDVFDYPFTDSNGATLILEMGIDVTDTKQAEAALKEVNETLEERVAKRTAELEEANKELDSFIYSVSHDLRAPLRAIDGYSRMILRQQGNKFDENTKDRFNVIRDNVKLMDDLINDLLAFSRLGRESLSMSRLNLKALSRDVWKELKTINPDRSMDLKIDSVPPAMGDHSLIRQVLINLFSNAVKFSRVRKATIIEMGGQGAEGENIYYIRDNGVGFDMQYHDKLFGVFQRLHSAADYEGTGVGLAIVQRIILRHGGRVWAEGEEGKGATFYFTLPTSQE